jgi:hypothetical protein
MVNFTEKAGVELSSAPAFLIERRVSILSLIFIVSERGSVLQNGWGNRRVLKYSAPQSPTEACGKEDGDC